VISQKVTSRGRALKTAASSAGNSATITTKKGAVSSTLIVAKLRVFGS
jgi:hypothetical protein